LLAILTQIPVPRCLAVARDDQIERPPTRPLGQRLEGLPAGSEGLLQSRPRDGQVGQKLVVRTVLAILGLARRRSQASRNKRQGEIVQDGAVVQQVRATDTQAVAGELLAAPRQVTGPLALNVGNQASDRVAERRQCEAVGRADLLQLWPQAKTQNHGIHETAGTDDDRGAAAAAAQDRNASRLARCLIHFHRGARGPAQHDQRARRFPEAQYLAWSARIVRGVQECLVQGEIRFGRVERQVDPFHQCFIIRETGSFNTQKPGLSNKAGLLFAANCPTL